MLGGAGAQVPVGIIDSEAIVRPFDEPCRCLLLPYDRLESADSLASTRLLNLTSLAGALRKFFRYCASHRYTRTDLSGLIPSVRHYRHASLPKGIQDSALERVLDAIDKDSPTGARDYAIAVLMMAYGIRGISAAELLLDDIDWQHSRIRIRAQKGGKEVILPLLEAVGEAIVRYLPHRFAETSFREVFLSTKAPFRPLSSVAISMIVRPPVVS